MDWDQALKLGTLLIALASLLGNVMLWLRKPGEESGRALAEVATKVVAIETQLEHTPTKEQLANLAGLVRAVETSNVAQNEQLNRLGQQLNRIESYLLGAKK